tara:strand:+ start:400 stop:2868 length:2469 start_codon:yes stop_codon:yes gene_type:complete
MADEKNEVVFEGAMVLREDIDLKVARAMAENFSEVYRRLGQEFWKLNVESGEYYQVDEKTAETIMKEFYQSKKHSSQVSYKYSSRMKAGRRFGKNSLQGISRKIRHTLAKDLYYDIDIGNAHPTFLNQLCGTLNYDHPILREYITNRDILLASWVGVEVQKFNGTTKEIEKSSLTGKDDVKQYFLKILNGGGNAKSNCSQLNEFYHAQQAFLNVFFTHPDYKRFRDRANNRAREKKEQFGEKTFTNPKGTALNYYLCEVEDRVLTFMEEFLHDRVIEYGTLCFDGLMVYQKDVPNVSVLLQDMEAWLLEKMEYPIQLKHKVMDEGIDVSDLIVEDGKEKRRIIRGDKEAGDLLYGELKASLVFCNGRFYNKTKNVWTLDQEALERDLRRYVMEADLWLMGKKDIMGKDTYSPYSQKTTHAQNCVKVIMDNAVGNRDDLWETLAFESSRGKVLFRNGYYDMKRGSFHHTAHPSFDPSIVFTEDIPYDYDESLINSEYVKSIHNRFFTLPFDREMGGYYLLKLARATAWDREKKFLAGIGSSNTGKSAISSALKHCLGGYFGTWNGVNICYKPNSSQDEAQKLRWMYLLRSKRIIVSNELQVGGMGIDGNMIKKLSNGGLDDIVAREHGGNETSFKVGFLPILFAQDLDRIRPMDDAVMTRLRAVNYQRVYVDEPSNEFELKIDRGLDNEVQTPAFRMGFMTLLFQTYKQWVDGGCDETEPDCVKHTVKEVVGSDTNIIDSFLNEFEITDNPADFVKSSDVERWMTEGKFRVTMTKFGMEMNKHLKIHKFQRVESKIKKIGGKAVRCWFGIKMMTDDEENFPML